jgi:hypothetical protein
MKSGSVSVQFVLAVLQSQGLSSGNTYIEHAPCWLMYYLPTPSKTSRTASEFRNLDRSLLSFTPAAIVSMMAAA